MKEKVFHIKTGGTIGGCVPEYPEITQLVSIFRDPVDFAKYVNFSFKLKSDYEEQEVCYKDSRDITDEDRTNIVELIEKQYGLGIRKFLISHGTYTMPETGMFVSKELPSEVVGDSTIILTGSMFPWNIIGSDAPMNLGASLACLLNGDQKGVHICMHGKLFRPEAVKKNKEELIFEEI